jgi:hypothetical protein
MRSVSLARAAFCVHVPGHLHQVRRASFHGSGLLARPLREGLAPFSDLVRREGDLHRTLQNLAQRFLDVLQRAIERDLEHEDVVLVVAGHARREVALGDAAEDLRGLGERTRHFIQHLVGALDKLAIAAAQRRGIATRVQAAIARRGGQRRSAPHDLSKRRARPVECVARRGGIGRNPVDGPLQVAQLIVHNDVERGGLRPGRRLQIPVRERGEPMLEGGETVATQLLRALGDAAHIGGQPARLPEGQGHREGEPQPEHPCDERNVGRTRRVGCGRRARGDACLHGA